MGPPLSCIIPCRNGARHLAETLASATLAGAEEIIVVDDGSTDDSAMIAAATAGPVQLLRQPAQGAAAARNAGLAVARHPLIAFLDADDLWPSGSLSRRRAILASDSALDAVYGHVEAFISPELSPEEARSLAPPATRPGRTFGSLVLRRTVFDRIGPLDPALQAGEMFEFIARFDDAGLVMSCLPEIVLRRRLHATNMMRSAAGATAHYPRALKALLDRRRAKAGP